MFNIKNFIMETLKGMKGNYPDFQIKEYALNWYEKGKLTENDLAEIEAYLEVQEEVIPEEEIVEETPVETEVEDIPEETEAEEIVEETPVETETE